MLNASLLLDLVALLLASSLVVTQIWGRDRVVVGHEILFCVGHAYYLTFGSIMATLRPLDSVYWFVYSNWNWVSPERRVATSLWSLGLLLAFLAGSRLGRSRPLAPHGGDRPVAGNDVAAALLVAGAVFVAFAGLALFYRSLIIEGYGSLDPAQIQGQVGRGVLSAGATAAVLSVVHLLNVSARAHGDRTRPMVYAMSGLAIVVPSLVLLRAGGRMYVATSLVALLVWMSHARRPVRTKALATAGLLGFGALTLLGALRVGESPNAETLAFYSTSESVLTGIGQANFLASDADVFAPLRAPKYLLGDLSNAVPRVLVPNKDDLRFDPLDDGFITTSPLGATSLQSSALINFGSVGSLFAAAAFGYGLIRLQQRALARRPKAVLAYSSIAAALTFSLFRDPFSISVARWMLLNAFALPGIYALGTAVVRRDSVMRNATSTVAATAT